MTISIDLPEALSLGWVFGGSILLLFWRGDDLLSKQAKADLAAALFRLDARSLLRASPGHFATAFDRVFGRRHFTVRCLLASFVCSLAAIAILTATWALMRPEQYNAFVGAGQSAHWLALIVFLSSLLPDYVALLETRFVVEKMRRHGRSLLRIGVLVVLDLAAKVIIFLAGLFLTLVAFITLDATISGRSVVFSRLPGVYARMLAEMFGHGLHLSAPEGRFPSIIFFYASCVASAWGLLYGLSMPLARSSARLQHAFGATLRILDFEEHPVRSLGFVAAVVGGVLYTLFALVATMTR